MARYRKVDVRMYADEKFQALSAPQANAQTLWVRLLTGEHTGMVPGVSRIGEAALAEQVGWSLEEFRRCFAEIVGAGMAVADWTNRILWLPNGIRYNEPDNQKVVQGWRTTWDELPDCALKAEAWARLDSYMVERDAERSAAAPANGKELKGPPFAEVFRKACPKPSARPSRKPSRNGIQNRTPNKEQEQEQEHDPKTLSLAGASAREAESQTSVPEAVDAAPPLAAKAVSGTDPRAAPSTTETTHEPEPGKPAAPETHAGAGATATTTATSGGPPLAVAAAFAEDNAAGLTPRELGALHRADIEHPEQRYPLTAQVHAALRANGREPEWGKPKARSSGEAAIRLAGGVESAVARLMTLSADEFVVHPWVTWWTDVIAGKRAGAHVSSGPRRGPRADAWEPAPAPTPTTEPHPLEDLIHDA